MGRATILEIFSREGAAPASLRSQAVQSRFHNVAKHLRLITLLLMSIIGTSIPALGWNGLGHMTVAYVAYQRLTPTTRNRVSALLQMNPDYNTWLSMVPAGTKAKSKRMIVF